MQKANGHAELGMSLISLQLTDDAVVGRNSSALSSLLYLTQLRLQDSNHRVNFLQRHVPMEKRLEPWRISVEDSRDKILVERTISIFVANATLLRSASINCLVLWHSACLSLAANMNVFELALGRAGVQSASSAVDAVAVWTHTPAARRACLHAGEVFHLLAHRRVSDMVNMHTTVSLFKAALVMGMYVLTQTQSPSLGSGKPLELLKSFDWGTIGNAGLGEDHPQGEDRAASSNFGADPAPVDFIMNGGEFSIDGDVYASGYVSARRVLLHFADLMEGMGKWKSHKFCRILHIISEDLMDVDPTSDEDD